MTPERPTFSPVWHRVRAMTPRLRPLVQITRQLYRGRVWHVAHDPSSNQFFRLSPIAHEFVGLLDGRRTVEEVWRIVLGRHGDAAPTQNEVIELLSQMYNTNLLTLDMTPEVEQLLRRGRERRGRFIKQQALGIMYFKIRVMNPDRYLRWLEPILRPALNVWGLLVWAVVVIAALASLAPEWDKLAGGFGSAIAPSNWGWLIAVFVVTKFIHETGHGVVCRRFGGQVPEFGFMMLVLLPSPYVDASAAWGFASKWRRLLVGAGGMIFELFTAALAAFVWLSTNEGQLAHQLAYNVMLTAGVTTVLFNANPLMRFDGYYMLSDLIEVPNLMQRSSKMINYLFQRHYYRIPEARPPSIDPGEQATLLVYGVLALAYRIFLFITITLWLIGQMFALGLLLAVWSAAAWFIIPTGKFVHWLATHQHLAEMRGRAVWQTIGGIALVVGIIGLVPMPDHRRAWGVVESLERSGVFAQTDGFLSEIHVKPGDTVRKGDPIATFTSPELMMQLEMAEAMRREMESVERRATAENPAAAQVAREKIAAQAELMKMLADRVEDLVVRAPHDGTVVLAAGVESPTGRVGAYLRRGDALCQVVDVSRLRVAATLAQGEGDWINELPRDAIDVRLRLVGEPWRVIEGGAVQAVEAAQRVLPHAALGFGGGGQIETEAQDQSGRVAKRGQWTVYIDPPVGEAGVGERAFGLPGERVRLKFTLPSKPLLVQWVDRLQKLVQGRVDI